MEKIPDDEVLRSMPVHELQELAKRTGSQRVIRIWRERVRNYGDCMRERPLPGEQRGVLIT